MMNRESRRDLLVFLLLVAFGVIGRVVQHSNFTPLAAVAAMGGYYFRGWLPALLLPVSVLAIADLWLLPHDSALVLLSVHAMSLVPIVLGRIARSQEGWRRAACWAACGFVPATAFYMVTNFAVWASKSLYEPTLAGLMHCYVQALPFYRLMLAGDVCYVSIMVGCIAAAHLLEGRPAMAEARQSR